MFGTHCVSSYGWDCGPQYDRTCAPQYDRSYLFPVGKLCWTSSYVYIDRWTLYPLYARLFMVMSPVALFVVGPSGYFCGVSFLRSFAQSRLLCQPQLGAFQLLWQRHLDASLQFWQLQFDAEPETISNCGISLASA